eukprot:2901425-Pyramimonas_sp.AAC.1
MVASSVVYPSALLLVDGLPPMDGWAAGGLTKEQCGEFGSLEHVLSAHLGRLSFRHLPVLINLIVAMFRQKVIKITLWVLQLAMKACTVENHDARECSRSFVAFNPTVPSSSDE